MTMHLAHPSLSTAGRRRGRVKFRNAEEARKARELESSWKELQKKWGVEAEQKRQRRAMAAEPLQYNLSTPTGRNTGHDIPSLDTGHAGAVTVKQPMQYTGTKVKGIGTMHKSNAVPIFSDDEAQDIARMRRG